MGTVRDGPAENQAEMAESLQKPAPMTTMQAAAPASRLAALVGRSRLALWWERVWPVLWLPLLVGVVFVAASWLGLWLTLPPLGRMAGVGLFALAFALSLWPLSRLRSPAERDALSRLDMTAPDGHRPASSVRDTLALGGEDPFSQALWKAHLERQQRDVAALTVASPAPGMARIDRYALRCVPVLVAAAAFFVAGPEANFRMGQAFNWSAPKPPSDRKSVV